MEDFFATGPGVEDEEGEERREEVEVAELVGDDDVLVGWKACGRGRGGGW